MIAVVVGREDRGEPQRREVDAERGEPRGERARPYPGVDQDAHALGLDEERVAARPGAQDERTHRREGHRGPAGVNRQVEETPR